MRMKPMLLVVIIALSLGGASAANADSSSLADLIAATPDGGTLELSGQYVVKETVEIFDRRGLTIQGDGTAVIRQRDRDGDKIFLITGGSDITLRGFEIVGANPDAGNNGQAYSPRKALGSGIAVKGVDGLLIEGMHIRDTWGDFIDLDRGGRDFPTTSDVRIVGNTLERNGRHGVSISRWVVDVLIEDNQVSGVARSVVDIEHAKEVSGIDIVRNEADGFRNYFLLVGRGGSVSDVAVVANTVTGPGSGPDGGKGFVNILLRDPTNLVQEVVVCDNVVDRYLDQSDFSGATAVATTC
jgi:hypothetical protein